MSTSSLPIERHPDMLEMHDRYDRIASNPAMQVDSGLVLLAGLYMAGSPWIVGFSDVTAMLVPTVIVGLAVAFAAVTFTSEYRRLHGMAFTIPVLGAWMIISPWVITGVTTTTAMIWSCVVAGAVVVVCGLAMAGMAGMALMQGRRRH